MNCEITILVENTTPIAPLKGEYGFAAYVKTDVMNILFDTGLGEALIPNAKLLGKNLSEIHTIVISHGHFDHTGGVLPFAKMFGGRPLYCHPKIFGRRPHLLDDGSSRDIGCAFSRAEFRAVGGNIRYANKLTLIAPGIYLSGEIPRIHEFEDVGGNFIKINASGESERDYIPDDMALFIDHPDGLIILSGCAHAGILNTIDYAKIALKKDRILCYIGGTHLLHASDYRIKKTIEYLNSLKIGTVVASHCTGFKATCMLSRELTCEFIKGETGIHLNFKGE